MLQAILLAFKILTLTGYTSVLRKEQSCTHVASLSVNIEPFEKMRKNLSSERTDDIGVNSPWNVVYDALESDLEVSTGRCHHVQFRFVSVTFKQALNVSSEVFVDKPINFGADKGGECARDS